IDDSRPFPIIHSKELNIGVLLKDNRSDNRLFGTIQIPDVLDKVLLINSDDIPEGELHLIHTAEVIVNNLKKLFIKKKVTQHMYYRVLRRFEPDVSGQPNDFIAKDMRESLRRNINNDIVFLQVSKSKKEIFKILEIILNINKNIIYNKS